MNDKKEYVEISGEERRRIEEKLYTSIVTEFQRDEAENNFYKYEVILRDMKFITYMSDEELRLSAGFAVDLLEELKRINNSGMDRQMFEQIVKEKESDKSELLWFLGAWERISTERMRELLGEIDKIRRVGGAWALLIANPGLINAICVVYERIVDRFEDKDVYELSGYFLLRAIMRMHSEEVKTSE